MHKFVKENKLEGVKLKWILFFLLFTLTLVYSYLRNVSEYPWDSQYYWTVADGVINDGFHILNFPETFRGYFFPLLVSVFKKLFHGVWGWRVLSSLGISACFAFSLPNLLRRRNIDSLREFVGILIAYGVFMWVWGDFSQYPLSDIFASIFLVSAASLLALMSEKNIKIYFYILGGGTVGALLYASYNTRAAYLYGIIAVLLLFILFNRKKKKELVIGMITVFIGMLILALPQCIINKHYTDRFSPKVFSEQLFNYDQDLQTMQVFIGLTNSKYDTFIGDEQLYSSPGVVYTDPAGVEILRREAIDGVNFRITDVFKLVTKYPLDMLGIYVRHAISLLTPSTNEAYITNIYNGKSLLATASIIIWIVAGGAILNSIKKINKRCLWVLAVFLPSFLQLFGQTELRFFLTVYMVSYVYVFAVIDYNELWSSIKDRWLSVLIGVVAIYVLWISLYGSILADNSQKTFLIGDSLTAYELTEDTSSDNR